MPPSSASSNATVLKILLYFLSFLADKAAACATLRAAFDTQPQNWTLLDCNIECCTGHNCNNQNVTVVPPTAASTPTPAQHGNTTAHNQNVTVVPPTAASTPTPAQHGNTTAHNQNVTVVPPTAASTPTPAPHGNTTAHNQNVTDAAPPSTASTPTTSTPTSEPHGNSCCNMSKTRASTKPEFLTCLLK